MSRIWNKSELIVLVTYLATNGSNVSENSKGNCVKKYSCMRYNFTCEHSLSELQNEDMQ